MKIAVSALGTTPDDKVDDRFGRARYLQFYSADGELVEVVENAENRNAMQGAGIGTAELVAGRSVDTVITGHLGPKAFDALAAAGVSGFSGSGMTVREAVEAFRTGKLAPLSEAGPAHAGL